MQNPNTIGSVNESEGENNEWDTLTGMEERKESHPNLVEDIEKARFMAHAENTIQTSRLGHEKRGRELEEQLSRTNNGDEIRKLKEQIATNKGIVDDVRGAANRAGEFAGEMYDEVHSDDHETIRPNLVEDPERAQVMAEAGNTIEGSLVGHKRRLEAAKERFDSAYDSHGSPHGVSDAIEARNDVRRYRAAVKEVSDMAKSAEEAAGRRYDQENN